MSQRIKNMAAQLMKCGVKRVRFNTTKLKEINEVGTREDIRKLIVKKYITKKDIHGISRGRTRKIERQKKKGRRKGPAHKQGSQKSFDKRNKVYVKRIRTTRDELRKALNEGVIDTSEFRYHYRRCRNEGYESRRKVRLRIEKRKEALN